MSGKRSAKNLYVAAMMMRMAAMCKEGSADKMSHFELAEKLLIGWSVKKDYLWGKVEGFANDFALDNLIFYDDMWDKHIAKQYGEEQNDEKE